MNICFFLISGGWGGAENVVYNLAKFMEKKGYNISIILNNETYPYFKDLGNVRLYNIGPIFNYVNLLETNFGITIPPFFSKFGIFSKELRFFLGPLLKHLNYRKIKGNVLEMINRINPDVIHFHNPIVLELYFLIFNYLKYPTIYTSHGMDFKKRINLVDKLIDIKKRTLLMDFDKITAVSENLKGYLKINKVNTPIKVIPNGLDFNNFETFNNIQFKEKSSKRFTMIFPGGVKSNKGGLILLRTMEILNSKNLPIKLYYAGITTKTFVEENKVDNVTFTGFLQHEEYLNKLDSCDCLILLSKTEQFPISIIEAMALGKAIITTPVGGIPEFCLNERNGLYVERNPGDVAEKILYLYKNSELRREISKNNIQDVKNFDWNNIVNQYIDLYRSLMISK